MINVSRRGLLGAGAAAAMAHPAIARALSIPADVRTGTLDDVRHVVILMQENRSFDHYFGTMNGVRGFGDRFAAPAPALPDAPFRTVFLQPGADADSPPLIAPFPLNTRQTFAHMRVQGTPHSWGDAQRAWDQGRMSEWTRHKHAHSMGHFDRDDLPFQFALADAFTLCDAYHCAMHAGTNPNRLFLWTGTNDPAGAAGGPAIDNSNDSLPEPEEERPPYRWTTYAERLQAAGIDWRIYQDMADNFTDNPVVGFDAFQASHGGRDGSDPELARRGMTTRALDGLREDVLSGHLPQVSWIVATAEGSEHPGPSSPAQGADYTARVIDALTADPAVWSRTVLLIMFDENDGYFDHAPPPAPPSSDPTAPNGWAGASTASFEGERHLVRDDATGAGGPQDLMGRAYGLGPRVPLYVVSPWSRGGRVCSEVFDHTSVIRFLERRFGVNEPNISPWRRAVCGDLTSAFDFASPNGLPPALPDITAVAARARALPGRTTPPIPASPNAPVQAWGLRPACPSPYVLSLEETLDAARSRLSLTFRNAGTTGAVFHVYDRQTPERLPRRYTVEAGKALAGEWEGDVYDLMVIGPDGFHRRLAGRLSTEIAHGIETRLTPASRGAGLILHLASRTDGWFLVADESYGRAPQRFRVHDQEPTSARVPLGPGGWFDVSLVRQGDVFRRRYAGRIAGTGPWITDPALGGPAPLTTPAWGPAD